MADPIGALILSAASIADVAGIGAFTVGSATFAGVSLSTIVGTAAITAASIGISIGLQYAFAPGLPKPEAGSQAVKQSIPPRIRGYGTNRLAGYYMLFEAGGPGPNTSYDVMAFHSGRINNIVAMFLHDDQVPTDVDISLGGFGTVTNTYSDGRYGGGKVQIETRIGTTTQTALASFIGDPLINALWTSAHRGRGIAYAGLKCFASSDVPAFTKTYPHQLPVFSVIANCSPVWDPRNPAQHLNDETTWVVSFNPVVQLLDYLIREDGGMGLDYATVILPNLAAWMAEADLCDVLVDTASGGPEPRYKSSGWFQFDNKPEDVIGGILATCDGWLAESGDGTLSIVVGVYRTPVDPPLTEKHIFGFALNYGQSDESTVNQLEISFTDPSAKYVEVQTEPWRDEDAIALTGIVRSQPINLRWVQSNSQARRLAGRAIQRLNPLMTGSFTTSLYGLRYLGKRWVPLQYPFVSGLQNCVVEIQDAEIDLMAGRIVWSFIRISPDAIEAYTPADEGAPPVVPPSIPVRFGLTFNDARDSGYLALLEDI